MFSLGVAFKAFFSALFNRQQSERIAQALETPALEDRRPAADEAKSAAPPEPKPTPPARSDALLLLELLQREGRLIDFLMEDIEGYGDADVGAAVRDVHRGCRELVQRVFSLEPLSSEHEGATIEVPSDYSATQFRLVGQVSGDPPFRGELLHHGWAATKLTLPEWTGHSEYAKIVYPIEVEVKQ